MSTKASKKVANNANNKKGANVSAVEKPNDKSREQTVSDEKLVQNDATKNSDNITKNSNNIGTPITDEQSTSGSIFSSRDQTILLVLFIAFTLVIWTIAPFQAQNNPNDVPAQ